jgi:hypothetical protein
MGYFDGLTASSFKKDDKGNTIFYPWGILGKGYILPEDRKDTIRLVIKRHMIFIVPFAIVFSIFLKIWILIIALPFYFFGYAIWIRQLTRGLEVTSEKLTLSDTTANSARAHNMATLWLLEICSLLFVLAGLFIFATSPQKWITGLSSITFFGISALVFWFMIKKKKEQER